jgi:hypothetical protein
MPAAPGAPGCRGRHAALGGRPPNLIVIYTDDQRAGALGFINPRVQTPNIDRFAQSGVYFPTAFVVSSLCSPSRAQLLTGRYASQNGVGQLTPGANSTLLRAGGATLNREEPLVLPACGPPAITPRSSARGTLKVPECCQRLKPAWWGVLPD